MSAPVHEGDVLAGKYKVERILGEGGMGVVVAATHLQLDQKVALKFLLPEALQNPEIVARFAREARAAASIKTEHVARVIDVGALDSGVPYMVMEYLEGRDLEQVLQSRGPLPVAEAVSYVLQALEAVAEAHAAGIVHRDLKPANLFLARQPDKTSIVKVLDFGISKSLDPQTANLTSTSAILGSPHYMSPEQLSSSKRVDARSDIWAMGTILYELLTNEQAYPGDTMPQIVAAILQNQPKPIATLRPDVPAPLARAVERCLSSDPDGRFSDVGKLARALSPFAEDNVAQSAADSVARLAGTAYTDATLPPPSMAVARDRTPLAIIGADTALPLASIGADAPPRAPASAGPGAGAGAHEVTHVTPGGATAKTGAGWAAPEERSQEASNRRWLALVVPAVLVAAVGIGLSMRSREQVVTDRGPAMTASAVEPVRSPQSEPSAVASAQAPASEVASAPASTLASATLPADASASTAIVTPRPAVKASEAPRGREKRMNAAPAVSAETKSRLHMELK